MATAASDFEKQWNGRVQSYRPGPGWRDRIAPEVSLHAEAVEEIDPVDFEVIRQKLMAQNQHGAHGITFKMKRDPRITWIGRIIRRFSIDE